MWLFPISFPEPTCLLVSAKTWSSGIVNFQSPRFYEFWFHGVCVPWFTWRPEIKLMWKRSTKAFNTHWKEQYYFLKAKDTRALGMRLLVIPELCVLALTKTHMSLIYMYFSVNGTVHSCTCMHVQQNFFLCSDYDISENIVFFICQTSMKLDLRQK